MKLAAVTYAESSEKVNNKEEKFAIASASMNNYEARGEKQSLSKVLTTISNATRDGNVRYENFNSSSPEDRNANKEMKLSTAAAINAATGGKYYSNGATGWDGRDLKINDHSFGLNISNPKHDIYKVGDRPFVPMRNNGCSYTRQTTAAYGQTVFMRIHPLWIKKGGRAY